MNIFVLSLDPVGAARMQCDRHVVKMPTESGQMLCGLFSKGSAPWSLPNSYRNNPLMAWLRESKNNVGWLCEHGIALCEEYTRRYGRRHGSQDVVEWCRDHQHELDLPEIHRTQFALVMPDEHKIPGDPVSSYRSYYLTKASFARWKDPSKPPKWWTDR